MPGFEERIGVVSEETYLGTFLAVYARQFRVELLLERNSVVVRRGEQRIEPSSLGFELLPGDAVFVEYDNPYLVRTQQSLAVFLSQLFEPWKIRALVAANAVTVERGIARQKPKDVNYGLKARDWVWLDLEAPGLEAAMAEVAPPSVDYVFAPQGKVEDPFVAGYVKTLVKRPATKLLGAGLASLADVMKMLRTPSDGSFTRAQVSSAPLRTLYVVAHALDDGILHVPLNPMIDQTSYERLEQSIASGELSVPQEAVAPRPKDAKGNRVECVLRIRGCLIGKQMPLLRKLKEAVGPGFTKVVAPKVYCGAGALSLRHKRLAVLEYLWHDFSFPHKNEIKTRDALIKAFKSRGFHDWKGRKVDPDLFGRYLPESRAALTADGFRPVATKMRVTVQYGTDTVEMDMLVSYLYRVDEVSVTLKDVERKPVDDKALIDLLLVSVPDLDPSWSDKHPFPMAVRFGYQTMRQMFEGFNLKADHDAKSRDLVVKMHRYYHGLLIPITDGKRLVADITPEDPKLAPTIEIDESNDYFFGWS